MEMEKEKVDETTRGSMSDDDYVDFERHQTATIFEEDESVLSTGTKASGSHKLQKLSGDANKTYESSRSSVSLESYDHLRSAKGTRSVSKVHTATSTSVYRNL